MVKTTRPLAHFQDTPREALNWRVGLAIAIIGLAGLSRGGDEGTVGNMTESPTWQREFGVESGSSDHSNVVSMFQLGNIPGSLLAFFLADNFGRLRTVQICSLLWILGTAIWITSSPSLNQTLAGRFVAGIGVGGFPVVCPTFLAEIAPKTIRGLAVTIFSMSVYIGIVVGYGSTTGSQNGFDDEDSKVWQVPVSINFIWAGIFFIGSLFVRESPRVLVKQGNPEKGLRILAWYRGMSEDHPYVQEEFDEIIEEHRREEEAKHGRGFFALLKLIFTKRTNLYRLFVIGFGIQILGQWSGGGSLTIYAKKILEIAGLHSDASLYTTLLFGVVKLIASVSCAFFLVDVLGRKRSVFIGITLQAIAALYLTCYLSTVDPNADADADAPVEKSGHEKRASVAAIVMIFISGVGWALGINTIQYLVGTEVWPTELRAIATSMIMAAHFANQFGSSRATQPMLQAFDRWGLFAFWTVVSVLMLLYIFLLVPETSGRSLESMNELFELPWYKIGIASKKPIDVEAADRGRVPEGGLSEKEKIGDEIHEFETVETVNDSRGRATHGQ